MQRDRRHNPYPLTWEIPVGVACGVLLVLAVGVHLGNGLAHVAAGRGWLWPHPSELFAGVPTVLAGAATTGPIGVRAWVVAVELVLVGVLGWAAIAGWRRWGPSRLKGVATRDQAEDVLGLSRLRRVAPVVRPDLNRPRRPRGGQR